MSDRLVPTHCDRCVAEFFRNTLLQAETLHVAAVYGASAAEAFVNEELDELHSEHAQFSAGVSVDAPHATSVDGDASHTSTAPAEPPQPTRPDPGITERKPRR